jgi:hypothetical protein
MDEASQDRLKLDRRLIGRSSWISEEELARELEKLPDVSAKIAPESDAPAGSPASGGTSGTGSADTAGSGDVP